MFVTNRALSGKTLRELADEPFARGVHLRKITRNMVEMPILPETEVLRGDILTLAGSVRHVDAAVKALGFADRPLESTDLMTVAGGILVGGLLGAISVQLGRHSDQPVDVGRRAARRPGARLPADRPPDVRTHSDTGPGADEHARPERVHRDRRHQRRTRVRRRPPAGRPEPVPLGHRRDIGAAWSLAVLLGHYVFKFHPAILFGVCAGVRTTTAALGMIQDAAKSKVPALGYGMPYAIGNTLLTIFGMAVVLLMSRFG